MVCPRGCARRGLTAICCKDPDLAQLQELEEGFALEFKQTFGPSVRRKIPKIVASFSNSHGGWLIIGIADDSREVCPLPKGSADYSQIIGELCRHHVSPAPRFEVRFLANPQDAETGVVLVRIDEGDFPPYVADGIVEIREGSTSGPADSAALVDLYDRAMRRRQEVERFCTRTVFYPMADGAEDDAALFDLYLLTASSSGAPRQTIWSSPTLPSSSSLTHP